MGVALWDIQPGETSKAFAAFMTYLRLPPAERSIKVAAENMGYSGDNQLGKWSSANNWVERVEAYDSYTASRALVVVEASKSKAISSHIRSSTLIMAKAERLAMEMLEEIDQRFHQTDDEGRPKASLVELKRAVAVISELDTLKRRVLGLPTAFLHEKTDEDADEDDVYFVGKARDADEES